MKKRKIYYLAGLVMAGALALTGCEKNSETKNDEPKIKYHGEALEYYLEKPEPQTLDPYKHFFFKKFRTVNVDRNIIESQYIANVDSGSLKVPNGYIPVGTSTVDWGLYNISRTVQIWFINTKTVEVKPVFNEDINAYDFSDFGTVIEKEYDSSKTLK